MNPRCVLRFCHLNAQSLRYHIDVFRLHILPENFDVIAVSETWFKPWILDSQVCLPGYKLIRHDRERCRGGGIALFVKDKISYRFLSGSDVAERVPEYMLVEIWLEGSSKILLSVLYRPPNIGSLHYFEEDFISFWPDYQDVIVLGDMNANLNTDDNNEDHIQGARYYRGRLRNFFQTLGMNIIAFQPTYHQQHVNSWLDVIAVDNLERVIRSGQSTMPFLSGHDLLLIEYAYGGKTTTTGTSWYGRRWDRVDQDILEYGLNHADWTFLFDNSSIDLVINTFSGIITRLIDEQAPLQHFPARRFTVPGITTEICDLIREEKRSYRKWRRTDDIQDYESYKQLRIAVRKVIRENQKQYLENCIAEKCPPRVLWSRIDGLGLTNRSKLACAPGVPLDLSVNMLNDYFVTMGAPVNQPRDDLVQISILQPTDIELAEDIPLFSFSKVTPEDVGMALAHVTSSAIGIDQQSVRMYRCFGKLLWVVISMIFNMSLSQGVFPELWKHAVVKPLGKVTGAARPEEFRPISLLPYLSKVLEKVVLNQLVTHVTNANLFDSYQTGFRADFGTHDAVLQLLEDIRHGFDQKHVTVAVFLDFSKAFDSVNHNILLHKLHCLGLDDMSLKWFKSYLVGRKQMVVADELLGIA